MLAQIDRNKSILKKYLPPPTVDVMAEWVYKYDFKLRIKKSRASKYGDYFPALNGNNHQITINNDLNKYAFLITLIHEIAHLTNFNKHKNKVKPHGQEWKEEYKVLMQPFLHEEVFPDDVIKALKSYMKNPAASSCSDLNLLRVLKQYDNKTDSVLLEQLPVSTMFKLANNRHFIKGDKIRTRFMCSEVKSNRKYLFNPLAEVIPVPNSVFTS